MRNGGTTEPTSPIALRFDPDSGDLHGPAGTKRLPPQPAMLLALLVEATGEVMDRERIKDRLWPGGRVEFDQGIAFAVREVRKAIEGVGGDPAVIETLPRRGFRVRGDLATRFDGNVSRTGPIDRAGPSRVWSFPLRRRISWRSTAAAVVALGMAVAVVVRSHVPGLDPVVVVFPYALVGSASPGVDPAALAEVLTARLTADLAGRSGVIGPTGSAMLSGPEDTEGVRARLGGCLILSGTLRHVAPDTVVVFSQIVRAADRVHVWARWDTSRAEQAAASLAAAAVGPVRDALGAC